MILPVKCVSKYGRCWAWADGDYFKLIKCNFYCKLNSIWSQWSEREATSCSQQRSVGRDGNGSSGSWIITRNARALGLFCRLCSALITDLPLHKLHSSQVIHNKSFIIKWRFIALVVFCVSSRIAALEIIK